MVAVLEIAANKKINSDNYKRCLKSSNTYNCWIFRRYVAQASSAISTAVGSDPFTLPYFTLETAQSVESRALMSCGISGHLDPAVCFLC